MDLSVIRLTHCNRSIFSVCVPEVCPSCGETLRGNRLSEAPVSVPTPFTNAHKGGCCLLIQGDFDGTSDLHTGISNTTGAVYNYTPCGLSVSLSGWERCVSVPLVRPDMFPLLSEWDRYLQTYSEGPLWDPAWTSFHGDDHNCFSFCLGFINSVLCAEGRGPLSKHDFTHCYILPRVRRAGKYNTLINHLSKEPHYMVEREGEM